MARILCIEDDAETRILLKKTLENAGHTVDAVWGGDRGLEAAMSGLSDCVLLDLMMPGMDGFQVLSALRAQGLTRELPVVVVSAFDDADTRRRAAAAGADAFVSKPFQVEDLLKVIEQALAQRPARAGV